jgi:hypothetical protein
MRHSVKRARAATPVARTVTGRSERAINVPSRVIQVQRGVPSPIRTLTVRPPAIVQTNDWSAAPAALPVRNPAT